MPYFVLSSGEDGFSIEEMDREEVINRLNENYYGDSSDLLVSSMPTDSDPDCWGNKLIIIEGKIVHPRQVKTVTEWEVGR
jgi:hypothetical protein